MPHTKKDLPAAVDQEEKKSKNSAFFFEFPIRLGYLESVVCLSEGLLLRPAAHPSTPHNHHDYEIYYVNSGHGTVAIEGKNHTLSTGDLILIHPFEYHCQTQFSSNTSFFTFRFSIKEPQEKENQPQPMRAYTYLDALLQEIRSMHSKGKLLSVYFNRLHTEAQEKRPGYMESIQALFSVIMIEILRLTGNVPEWFFPSEEFKFRSFDRNAIDHFFVSKYLTNVKIQDLAFDMKVSVRQVNRTMHRMFGMSFTQKLTEMRLWEVARQLTGTQKAVTTISQNCGFNNYNYFYICFRKKFNMTPTEYRLKNSKQ